MLVPCAVADVAVPTARVTKNKAVFMVSGEGQGRVMNVTDTRCTENDEVREQTWVVGEQPRRNGGGDVLQKLSSAGTA